jgi:hypothetical protein
LIELDNTYVPSSRNVTLNITNGTLTNDGVIRTSDSGGGGGSRTINAEILNTSTGLVDIQDSATINAALFDTEFGAVNIAASQILEINAATTNVGTATRVTGTGTVRLNGTQTLNVASDVFLDDTVPDIDLAGSITINGAGSLTILPTGTLTLTTDTVDTNLDNQGTLTVRSSTSHVNGALSNSGSILVQGTSTSSSPTLTVANGFTNAVTTGLIELDNTYAPSSRNVTLNITNGTLTNDGVIRTSDSGGGGDRTINAEIYNSTTGLIDIDDSLVITKAGASHFNDGIITIGDSQTLTLTDATSTFTNAATGVITLQGISNSPSPGTSAVTILDVSGLLSFTNDGLIDGFGTVIGSVNGRAPEMGTSPGLITIEGDLINNDQNHFEVELEGEEEGTEYDQLVVTGTADLRGQMNVTLLSGYLPTLLSGYLVLKAGELRGSFDEVNGLDVSDKMVLDLDYTTDGVELVAVAVDREFSQGDDVVEGSDEPDVLLGGAGNDSILGFSGEDIIYGQSGDDSIQVASDFKRVDGGAGIDTLALSDSIDLSGVAGTRVDRVEILRLTDANAQLIELDTDAIKNIVDGDNALTGIENSIVIVGDENDLVRLYGDFNANGDMQIDIDGSGLATFHIYTDGEASILLSDALTLEVNHLDGQVISYNSGEVIDANEAIGLTEIPGSLFSDTLALDGLENLFASDSLPFTPDMNILDILVQDDVINLENLLAVADSESAITGSGTGSGDAFAVDPDLAGGSELFSASAQETGSVVPFSFGDIAQQLEYEHIGFSFEV